VRVRVKVRVRYFFFSSTLYLNPILKPNYIGIGMGIGLEIVSQAHCPSPLSLFMMPLCLVGRSNTGRTIGKWRLG
jgi:hypothetical protein